MKTINEITAFECICDSPEHTLHIEYDPDVDTIAFNMHLNQYRNIFKRIWTAIKYVFGYKCKYGHWDVFELKREDIPKFKEILESLEHIDGERPNYFNLNGEYIFFKDKQELIDKITSSKL